MQILRILVLAFAAIQAQTAYSANSYNPTSTYTPVTGTYYDPGFTASTTSVDYSYYRPTTYRARTYTRPLDYGYQRRNYTYGINRPLTYAAYNRPLAYTRPVASYKPLDYAYNRARPLDYTYDRARPLDYTYNRARPLDYTYNRARPLDYTYDRATAQPGMVCTNQSTGNTTLQPTLDTITAQLTRSGTQLIMLSQDHETTR